MTLESIRRSPRLGPAAGGLGIRKRNLVQFPYSAIDEIHGDEIRVLAVWHGVRDSGFAPSTPVISHHAGLTSKIPSYENL